jgi:hypothetical protein
MSVTVAVRISKRLKDELKELNLDYADEMRMCLERLVKRKKLKQALQQVDEFRTQMNGHTGKTKSSAEIIRGYRENVR